MGIIIANYAEIISLNFLNLFASENLFTDVAYAEGKGKEIFYAYKFAFGKFKSRVV